MTRQALLAGVALVSAVMFNVETYNRAPSGSIDISVGQAVDFITPFQLLYEKQFKVLALNQEGNYRYKVLESI
jgi:hypothetical protein